MCKFSKREMEILKLRAEGVKSHEIIRRQLGMNTAKQVGVTLTGARRKVIKAKKFYQNAMRDYGNILFQEQRKSIKA